MQLRLGIDRIDDLNIKNIFLNKRVGLITNPTGISSEIKSTIDVLNEKVNLVCLFSPEHGIRGNIQAGVSLDTYIDSDTNITVYSLFGKTNKPTKEMLDNVDILAIDIQDVGSRFYTYLYTMSHAMQAAKEFDKEFVVFDRPNPINASCFEGNILEEKYKSFVGWPILQRYGLTIGEVAKLFNKEFNIGCKLTIIEMEGYDRNKYYDELGKVWVVPSPNIPSLNSALVYNATCQFEGTNISEGRGTTTPFEVVGAPFINPKDLANKLNELKLKGVYFRPTYFTPTFSKHSGEICGGVYLHLIDRTIFEPVKTGWAMVYIIRSLYKDYFVINPSKTDRPTFFDLEAGCDKLQNPDYSLLELFNYLDSEKEKFRKIRDKYLIY